MTHTSTTTAETTTRTPRLLSAAFAVGDRVGKRMEQFLKSSDQLGELQPNWEGLLLSILNEFLSNTWSDEPADQTLAACIDVIKAKKPLNLEALAPWLRRHRNDTDAVLDSLSVEPPGEIDLIFERLPKTGSQKQVFLAR